jgi:acetyl-CoA carboxylase carboxyltransferase component
VIIATPDSNIGMAGPAMIEGGGLGKYNPEDIGPIATQLSNGVVDLLAHDDADAVRLAKKYVSYFQGTLSSWEASDQRELRNCIPENRLRIYDVHRILNIVVDKNSLLELRASFGKGMVTALARVQGRTIGVIANNPAYLSGAIDSDGADKVSRFMQLCDAFGIPLVSFCDTPGIMVGPDAEATALVRHAARMFVTSASLSVPLYTVVLRKGYGLGAQAMAGGSFKKPAFTISWPTGEFGGMGLEGAVRLGYKKELDAIENEAERKKEFDRKVDRLYQNGKAVNYATAFEIDGVIDPADTRRWIVTGLNAMPPIEETGNKGRFVDTW